MGARATGRVAVKKAMKKVEGTRDTHQPRFTWGQLSGVHIYTRMMNVFVPGWDRHKISG